MGMATDKTPQEPVNRRQRRLLKHKGRITAHLRPEPKTAYNKAIPSIVIRGAMPMSPEIRAKNANIPQVAWLRIREGNGEHKDIVELLCVCGTIAEVANIAKGDEETRQLWLEPAAKARDAILAMMQRHLDTEVLRVTPDALRWVPPMIDMYTEEVLPNLSLLAFTKAFATATDKLIAELQKLLERSKEIDSSH